MADLSSISGLNLWARPGVGLTVSGGKASAWADQSGAGNSPAQATAGNQPPSATDAGGPYLQFEYGLSHYMTLPSSLSRDPQAFSAFAVVQMLALSTPGAGQPQSVLACGSTDYISVANGFFVVNLTQTTLRVPSSRCVLGIVATGAGTTLYCNGQTAAGPALPAGAVTGGFLMADASGRFALGSVYEVGHWGRALSPSEAASAAGILAATYGINPAPTVNVALDGDSLSFGVGAALGQNYPRQMALPANIAVYDMGLPSQQMGAATAAAGTGGAVVAGMATNAAANVDTLYDGSKAKNIVVVWALTNDIISTIGNASGAVAYARLAAYCQARKAAHPGWYIVVVTPLPRSGGGGGGGTFEADRAADVALTLAGYSAWADAVVNLAADPAIGQAGQNTNTANYAADAVHLNNAGYGIVAAAIKAKILAALGPTAPLVTGAAISADGGSLAVAFSQPLQGPGFARDFSLSSGGGFSGGSLSADGLTLTLTLHRPAFSGEAPALAYAGSSVRGAGGLPLAAFAGQAVSNGSTRRAFGPPATLNVAYPNFTWPTVPGATGYRLYANGVPVYDTANASGANTLTAFTDPAATDGRPVDQPSFSVSAYDGTGEGPRSGTPLGTASILVQQAQQAVTLAERKTVSIDDVRYDLPAGAAVLVPASVRALLQNDGLA